MICLDHPGAVTTEHRFLACPTCKLPVKNEGFGLVSCQECRSIMARSTAVVATMQVV